MFKLTLPKALSYGDSGACISIDIGRCQRKQRLPNLSGFRTHPHRHSTQTVPGRGSRHRFAANHVCTGLDDHRPLSDDIPMGTISQKQGSDKITYAFRCSWKYTDLYQCNSWESSRCEYDECLTDRRQFRLCYGQGLLGFSKALSNTYYPSLLCNKGETQYAFSPTIFKSSGQNDGHPSRSDYCTLRQQIANGVSGITTPGALLRCGSGQKIHISDQSFWHSGKDCSGHLSLALAGRVVFQMDKAASAHKVFLRDFSQRSKNPSVDCNKYLSSGGDCEKEIESARKFTHNSTDFGSQHF